MAATRNPANVQPVVDGQVLVSFADNAKIGLDGHFNEDWETVGILADGSTIGLQKVIEKNKTPGWGFGVVAVATKPGDLTGSCEVIEDNDTVQKIAWATKRNGVLFHDGVVARPYVAYVEKLQNGKTRIRATRHPAMATMEDLGIGESPEGKTIDFEFLPGPQKDVFDELVLDATDEDLVSVPQIRFDETANAGAGGAGAASVPDTTGGDMTVASVDEDFDPIGA